MCICAVGICLGAGENGAPGNTITRQLARTHGLDEEKGFVKGIGVAVVRTNDGWVAGFRGCSLNTCHER